MQNTTVRTEWPSASESLLCILRHDVTLSTSSWAWRRVPQLYRNLLLPSSEYRWWKHNPLQLWYLQKPIPNCCAYQITWYLSPLRPETHTILTSRELMWYYACGWDVRGDLTLNSMAQIHTSVTLLTSRDLTWSSGRHTCQHASERRAGTCADQSSMWDRVT